MFYYRETFVVECASHFFSEQQAFRCERKQTSKSVMRWMCPRTWPKTMEKVFWHTVLLRKSALTGCIQCSQPDTTCILVL